MRGGGSEKLLVKIGNVLGEAAAAAFAIGESLLRAGGKKAVVLFEGQGLKRVSISML